MNVCMSLSVKADYTAQEYLQHVRNKVDLFLPPAHFAISSLVYLHLRVGHDPRGLLQTDPFIKYAAQGWGKHSHEIDDHPTILKYAVGLLLDDARVEWLGDIAQRYLSR
jgi:hypothetical protein